MSKKSPAIQIRSKKGASLRSQSNHGRRKWRSAVRRIFTLTFEDQKHDVGRPSLQERVGRTHHREGSRPPDPLFAKPMAEKINPLRYTTDVTQLWRARTRALPHKATLLLNTTD